MAAIRLVSIKYVDEDNARRRQIAAWYDDELAASPRIARVAMAPGEVWYFDNLKEHEVVNDGPDDRITLIICLRCER